MTTYEQIMEQVSYALIEPILNTEIQSLVQVGMSTSYIVTPFVMTGIYVGSLLTVAQGGSNYEAVTVTGVSPTTFTAAFVNTHAPGDAIVAALFPSGQQAAPLFTQQEIIGYINDSQSDFLVAVRPIFEVVTAAITPGVTTYTQPVDCIRLERIAVNPQPLDYNSAMTDLYETSQASLDLSDPNWQGAQAPPAQWYRDDIANGSYGYFPIPSANYTAELWYSQDVNPTVVPNLLTTLLVPDAFAHVIKYLVLAKCWTKDGETRDPDRAEYCQKRAEMTTIFALKFMTGLGVNLEQGAAKDPDFSPMPIKAQG